MKIYPSDSVRNLAVAGHGGCGKTTLLAAALFTAGATPRQGRVEEGTTVTDFDEESIARRVSTASALACAEWQGRKLNFVDTPGANFLFHEVELALPAIEAILLIVDGAAGVEVQTEKIRTLAQRENLPVIVVISRMDRERADAERSLESLRAAFGRTLCPVQLPMGQAAGFTGVVDLVNLRALTAPANGAGNSSEGDIPAALAAPAAAAHEALVELVAEGNDALLEEFFEKGAIGKEHLESGLKAAIAERRLTPVLFSAGLHTQGSDALLNFLAAYAPSPLARAPRPARATSGEAVTRNVADDQPLALYVFKTMVDPFAGRVSFFKVAAGLLHNDDAVANFTRSGQEKISHLSVMQGKQAIAVAQLHAGDLGAAAKLRDVLTGDTLGDKSAPLQYASVALPEAAISFALSTHSRGDEDKLGAALHKMLEEDLGLHFYRDPQTNEFLLAGASQQHVEIALARLKHRYHVEAALQAPKVPYRETIRGKADVQGRYKKQTGGHGQYGDCKIKMEPLARGAGFEFVNDIFGGAIPRNFIPAVEKGIVESAQRGFLARYPVVDFKVILYDGSYHDVDSSELAFKVAGSMAFKKAMEQAKPALLEPIMEVEIQAPQEFAGDLMGDLNSRRGRIEGMETRGATQLIRAQVPMAEMLSYQSDLTSKTQGRGSFHMSFARYDLVPPAQAEKIIAQAKAAHGDVVSEEE